jgi:D-alanyl-lipoteichoic acid acyltransferase DltB (MBOAT superfamily)
MVLFFNLRPVARFGLDLRVVGHRHRLASICLPPVGQKRGGAFPKALAWFLYFNFFNFSVVFFRAETVHDALKF